MVRLYPFDFLLPQRHKKTLVHHFINAGDQLRLSGSTVAGPVRLRGEYK
jgi:hypothetical protein